MLKEVIELQIKNLILIKYLFLGKLAIFFYSEIVN